MKRFFYIIPIICTVSLLGFVWRVTATQAAPVLVPGAGPTTPYPILFVTQPPLPYDFTSVNAVFGNHHADLQQANRGGDLWIRYTDGTLKNLTAAAGYGSDGFQGANAIAVRDPAVYWDGSKALFSMVVGAPTQQYQVQTYYWQIYEITGLGQSDTPVITKLANQPANYNNISPIYGTDDRIIFTSDRPFNGAAHLYPQRDEYEEAPTVSGLWSLDPTNGDLRLINHAPSGDFTPTIDSFGRLIFTQWDHLQRDQQADSDAQQDAYGTFNYADESVNAAALNERTEVFPEPRDDRKDLLQGTNLAGHSFNHFLPWQINEDGSEAEIINHLGRHELHGYIPASLTDDPKVFEFYGQITRFNQNRIENMLQVRESPATAGLYYGIDAPEFSTHAAGQIISLSAPPTQDADHIQVSYITHRDTASYTDTPSANHSGHYRDPLPLSDGKIVAAHTNETREDKNEGTTANPLSRYAFRLKTLKQGANGFMVADQALTAGIIKNVNWWDPDNKVTYNGELWELQPVEVRARPRPARLTNPLPGPEQQVFTQAGVDLAQFQAYLKQQNLAVIVTRNVTTRDDFDKQQPYNLRVPNGVQTLASDFANGDKIYDVAHLQLFQADLIRGLHYGSNPPYPGRRVLAQVMHDPAALAINPANSNGPPGSVAIAADGSAAAFVPARRALTWQLTAPGAQLGQAGYPGVVRERNWLTFQPGEIRVCSSCHGLSQFDQAGHNAPNNQPQALLTLLQHWKNTVCTGNNCPVVTTTPTATPTVTPTPSTTPTPTTTPVVNQAPPKIGNCTIFPADNIWNTAIDTLPVDANSAAYINTIGATANVHADFGSGLWDGGPIGIPFVAVPGSQAKVAITFKYQNESDPGPYPIPTDAPIEGGSNSTGDRHVLVLDQDNCKLYEVYRGFPQSNGSWKTDSGAIFDLASHALRPTTWTSADAAGLPILPGLVRYEEVINGEINHAIRFTVPETRNTYIWPARHQASDLTGNQYPPMGQRFRLKASFDISGYSPQVQVILRAMKKYGLLLADNGSSWYISGAPDERWDNDMLHELDNVVGSDFEAVDEAALMLDVNSGQARSSPAMPTATPTTTPIVIPTTPPGGFPQHSYLPQVKR